VREAEGEVLQTSSLFKVANPETVNTSDLQEATTVGVYDL
jgi:hypothetical protein